MKIVFEIHLFKTTTVSDLWFDFVPQLNRANSISSLTLLKTTLCLPGGTARTFLLHIRHRKYCLNFNQLKIVDMVSCAK